MAPKEWSHNTSQHFGTDVTPYEFGYGKPPPFIPSYMHKFSNNEVVDSLLVTRDAIHSSLKCQLTKAEDAMKYYADEKHRDKTFEVGQQVYVKLRPY